MKLQKQWLLYQALQTLKGNRTLVWKPHLGFSNIELEIGDKKINLTVSLIHAAFIYKVQEAAEWTTQKLATSLKLPLPPWAGRSPGNSRGCWWRTHQTPSVWWRRGACLASPTACRRTRRTASLPAVQTRGRGMRSWVCSGLTSWACSPTWRVFIRY